MKQNTKSNMARWERRTHFLRADEYICSACHASVSRPAKRCPGCGAEMKQGKANLGWIDEAEGMAALLDEDW